MVHTALGMIKEEEKYPLSIKATDRDGEPALAYFNLIGPDGFPEFYAVDGTKELRLVPGTYSVISMMDVDEGTDHKGVALVGNPEINLNGPESVELDARKAKEIKVNVSKETEPNYRKLEYYRTIGESELNDIYIMPVWVDKMYAEPTKTVENGEFTLATRWRLAKPMLTINFKGQDLDDIPQAGSTLLKGKHNLETVFAGKGTPDDYIGLKLSWRANIRVLSRKYAREKSKWAGNLLIFRASNRKHQVSLSK